MGLFSKKKRSKMPVKNILGITDLFFVGKLAFFFGEWTFWVRKTKFFLVFM